MGKKAQNKALKKIADRFPLVMRNTIEYHFKTVKQLIEEDEIKEIGGVPVNPEGMYKVSYPVQIAINHHTRLKKLVKKMGVAAIGAYARGVDKVAKEQKAEIKSTP